MCGTTMEVKVYDELSGESYCVDEFTVAVKGIYVYVKSRGLVVKVERCERFEKWGPPFGEEKGGGDSKLDW
ncbi:hypothetical protein L195_g012512 [Trifolium pratense]|uniref:Uncharacterized protein n=1 Tax=Trifolium pratense TaxID=57577 RepID=A0A2K3LKT9_TRIPR|nr:hypothetical protein L195_g035116 [Trifolium pratense]PNY15809.1 hypothetical protein L195_g012512 [Trifolium pratense]